MSQPIASPATVPGTYILLLTEVLARWQISPETLLDDTGLNLAELANPLFRLPLASLNNLFEKAIQLTDEPGLSVLMGLQMKLSSHGFIGFAAMTARNVREALDIAQRFVALRSSAITFRLEEDEKNAYFYIDQSRSDAPLGEALITSLMVGFARMGEAVTNRPLLGRADVRFAEPAYYARFRSVIPGEINFNQPCNRLVFPRAYLDLPLIMADPVATQLAREQCERELISLSQQHNVSTQVRALIQDEAAGFLSVEAVAQRLHTSERTLKRQLAQENTSYSEILEDIRKQQAITLLEERELSIDRIADRLGYSDVANFTRAFKRWTGETPGQFRKK